MKNKLVEIKFRKGKRKMQKVKEDCFAYDKKKNKCIALKELECKNKECKFYKNKDSDKLNCVFKETMHDT